MVTQRELTAQTFLDWGDLTVRTLLNLLTLAKSRQYEYEADRFGMELAQRAGFNSKGALAVQAMFVEGEHSPSGPNWFDWVLSKFSTHPRSRQRLEALMQEIETQSHAAQPIQPLARNVS